MDLTGIRSAKTPDELMAALRAVGADAVLEEVFDAIELGVSPKFVGIWDRHVKGDTLQDTLGDPALWELIRQRCGTPTLTKVLFSLRSYVADRALRIPPTPAPRPAPAAPPPPRPPQEPPRDGDQLRAWAAANGVADLVDAPGDRAVGYYSHEGSVYMYEPRRPTVFQALTGTFKPQGRPSKARMDTYANAVAVWLKGHAEGRRRAAEADAKVRAAFREPTDPRVVVTWRALLTLRDSIRPHVVPVPATRSVTFIADPPGFVMTAQGECGWGLPASTCELELGGEAPVLRCRCQQARCPSMLVLVDTALRWIGGQEPNVDAEPVARALATRPWERLLADMDGLVAPVAAPPALIGWALRAEHPVWLHPLRCEPKKRGDGLKVVRATYDEVYRTEGGTAVTDRLVADTLPDRNDYGAASEQVMRAIERLAGHPRVFLDGRSTTPVQVRVGTLGFRAAPIGEDLRLVPIVAGEAVDPKVLTTAVSEGDRLLLVEAATVTVVKAPRQVRSFVDSLQRRGARFPREALPELARRLPALSRLAPVEAEELVRTLPLEPRLLVRLEVLSGDVLHVSARVRPRPDLPAQIPGEPPAQLFLETHDGVVSVVRHLVEEVTEVQARVAPLGLGPTLPEEPFSWLIGESERVLDVLSALQGMKDVDVVWAGLRKRVTTARPDALRIQVGNAAEWFAVGGELDVDGTRLPIARLLEAVAARRGFVKLDDHTWVRLERHFREQLEGLADATEDGTLRPVNAPLLLALQEGGVEVQAPARWTRVLDQVRAAPSYLAPVPEGLQAELRPYQLEGFRWLARLATWAEGAILADDMGLGKTVQALALLLLRAAEGPALVVAPTTVGFNWVRQAERFAPTLKLRLLRGADRRLGDEKPSPGDVYVTSYDLLIRDVEQLSGLEFATVVLDEAQAIKNPDTLRARAVRALKAGFRVALSGTPLENRTAELWSLFAAVSPGVFGNRERFRTGYALPIERDGDADRRRALARRIRPFVLRRLKSEVARDLPARTEIRVDVDLGADERALYDAARALALKDLSGGGLPEQQRRFQVLAALTQLRQLACHPRLVDEAAGTSSAKLDTLTDLLGQLREEGRKALVFSQFVRQLHLVRERLDAEGFRLRYLDGSTPAAERRLEVEAFQRGEADIFLLSLKAGGTGIDLTAASDVVILDPWWNPAVEDQAADRAHRIGQTQAVTIYRLVARDTVEERILALHASKRDLVSAVLEGTGAGATLSADELLELLREPVEGSGAARELALVPSVAAAPADSAPPAPKGRRRASPAEAAPPAAAKPAPAKAAESARTPAPAVPAAASAAPPPVAAGRPRKEGHKTGAEWFAAWEARMEERIVAGRLGKASVAVYRSVARRVFATIDGAPMDRATMLERLERHRADVGAGRIAGSRAEENITRVIVGHMSADD